MKKLTICSILMVLVGVGAAAMQAQNPPEAKNATGMETMQKHATEPERALGKLESLGGSLSMVNDAAKTLTVTGPNGTPYDFKITRETKIMMDGRPATFSDLATQMNKQAVIEFVPMSGGNFARSVELHSN